MNDSASRSRLIWIALALLAGILAFALAPNLAFAEGGQGGSSSEGGADNPVVGSLPCAVDPDMDLKFFRALGKPPPSGMILRPLPTLALAGPSLSAHVLDAWGLSGSVNAGGSSWSLLGLMQDGAMVTSRASVTSGQASLWNWLPSSVFGGRVTMTSNIGAWNWTVTESQFALPLMTLCANPAPVVDAWFTVTRQDGLTVCRYHVTIVASAVIVEFLQ